MTKHEAHSLLDDAKAGMDVPASLVMQALEATGDLDLDGAPLQVWSRPGQWERSGCGVMARAGVWDGLAA